MVIVVEDVYNGSRRVERNLTKLLNMQAPDGVSPYLDEFADKILEDDISDLRRAKYLQEMRNLAPYIEFDLGDPSIEDAQRITAKINNDHIRKQNGQPYAPASKKELRKTLRKFFRLHTGREHPLVNSVIKGPHRSRTNNTLSPIDIPRQEELEQLLSNAPTRQLRLLIAINWTTSCRIQEILNVKAGHIRKSDGQYWLDVPPSKTGPRTIPVLTHLTELEQLLQDAPSPDAYLFHKDNPFQIRKYRNYYNGFKTAAEDIDTAAILQPKMLRKSRGTSLAAEYNWNAARISSYMGNSINQAEKYIQLAKSDLKQAAQETITRSQTEHADMYA